MIEATFVATKISPQQTAAPKLRRQTQTKSINWNFANHLDILTSGIKWFLMIDVEWNRETCGKTNESILLPYLLSFEEQLMDQSKWLFGSSRHK